MNSDLDHLSQKYGRLLEERVAAFGLPGKANALYRQICELDSYLETSEEGRLIIETYLSHAMPEVRLHAASRVIHWNVQLGEHVLEEIERRGGLPAVTAKYTLKGFRAGKLR